MRKSPEGAFQHGVNHNHPGKIDFTGNFRKELTRRSKQEFKSLKEIYDEEATR